MSAAEENKLVIRKLIAASREEVYAEWTDAESMRYWMCPGDIYTAEATLDVRVGGSYRILMKGPKEDYDHTGEYQVVDPPSKLAFTWISKGTDMQPTLVTVEFFARAEGCELVLTHERFPSADAVPKHQGGWTQIAERLTAYLASTRDSRTIVQEVTLQATPAQVFEALVDATQHARFSGAPAEIDRRPGGKFSLYGGQLQGQIVELQAGERIVENWRSENWPAGRQSRLTITLTAQDGGRATQLSLKQTGVPADRFDDISQGWRKYYWEPMARYFSEQRATRSAGQN